MVAARKLADIETKTRAELWHLPAKQDLISSVIGGGSDELTAAGRWMLYSTMRQDLNLIRHSLVSENWQTINPVFTD